MKGAEGTVPDLRTERSGVVASGLSPAKRNAASFAVEFGCGKWERLAGLWQDSGNYSIEFQVMLTNLLEDRIFHELHCAN